jgi:hypothetical protein
MVKSYFFLWAATKKTVCHALEPSQYHTFLFSLREPPNWTKTGPRPYLEIFHWEWPSYFLIWECTKQNTEAPFRANIIIVVMNSVVHHIQDWPHTH